MRKKLFFIISVVLSVFTVLLFCFFMKQKAFLTKDININFAKNGNVFEYQKTGFSGQETNFIWTDGKEATIVIPIHKMSENKALQISVDAQPFVAKKIKSQVVDVIVNDKKVARWNMEEAGIYNALIPHEAIKDELNVRFQILNPKSPKELGVSKDSRKLGIAVKSMKITTSGAYNPGNFSEYDIGRLISFEQNGNSDEFIGQGWNIQEKHARWTAGNDAYVNLFIKDVKDKNLQLLVFGRALFAPEESYQQITVYVNDTEVAIWKASGEFNTYSVMLPESVLGTGALQIRFHIAKPWASKPNDTKLGLFVKEIRIREPVGVRTKIKIALWLKNKVLKNVKGSAEENPGNI